MVNEALRHNITLYRDSGRVTVRRLAPDRKDTSVDLRPEEGIILGALAVEPGVQVPTSTLQAALEDAGSGSVSIPYLVYGLQRRLSGHSDPQALVEEHRDSSLGPVEYTLPTGYTLHAEQAKVVEGTVSAVHTAPGVHRQRRRLTVYPLTKELASRTV